MYALFEDAGKFLAGRVMSEAESSMQIELDSGKRVKVKAAHVLLRFEKPAPAELLAEAGHANGLDLGDYIVVAANPLDVACAQILQQQWAEAGIKVALKAGVDTIEICASAASLAMRS